MPSPPLPTRAESFFRATTARPRTVLAIGFAIILWSISFLPGLTKDTSAEAFIPQDHPSVIYRDKVEEIFGLSDPIVIAVLSETEEGIFDPHTLGLVHWLTEKVSEIDGVDPERVTSLATENDIIGTEEGLEVSPFFEDPPTTREEARAIRDAVLGFPLYVGSLVAKNADATLIVAELTDQDASLEVYEAVLALVQEAPVQGEEIHVAGEGAVTGYLGSYIDTDAMRLNPLAAVVISIILFIAYRTWRGVLLPNMVVLTSVAVALGLMAAAGVPFYVITNALPVLLIGISVADGIHILGQYYEELAADPQASARELTVRSMIHMWRPVTITSATDIAGLLGLSLASYMPPMRAFGLYASVGIAAAWLCSMLMIPAVLTLLRPRPSRAFQQASGNAGTSGEVRVDGFGHTTAALGRLVTRRPGWVLAMSAAIAVAGVLGVMRLEINEARIENFKHSEPLHRADSAINRTLDGTNYLDVVIETDRVEGLFELEHLRRIEALQAFLETQPHVRGTTSIVDYLKQMNQSLNEDRHEAYTLPGSSNLVAQVFLLYSASGEPTDFEEEVDYDYRLANVRATLDTGLYTNSKVVVENTEAYLRETFNGPGIRGHLAGRVNVDYHWIEGLAVSHFRSLTIAFLAAWLMACISFRSFSAGSFALVPVLLAVLLIYAVMGFTGIWLGVGTSMFAAIAIGTAVDFAVHTLDRLIVLVRREGHALDDAFALLFPATGRALLFNFASILLGFGVLTLSQVPPLIRFGSLVAVAVSVSFLASLTVLPALVYVLRPAFLTKGQRSTRANIGQALPVDLMKHLSVFILISSLALASTASADSEKPGVDEIARRINNRDDGHTVFRNLTMEMIDRRGKKRVRETSGYRKYFESEKGEREKRTVLFYLSPTNVKDTGFLTFDYPEAERDDDQWLYLPALRKVRRISASDRGDYFLGTDFTYEDIKKETKVSREDYRWTTLEKDQLDGHPVWVVEGVPINEGVAKELGYGRVKVWVDANIWMARHSEFWDIRGNPLKSIHTSDIRQVQGIWTAHFLEAKNHKTGHTSRFTFRDVDYAAQVDDDLFTERAIKRGL